MLISEHLKPSSIEPDLKGRSVEEVIGELSELVARESGALDAAGLRECLIDREKLLSTAMGAAIAFPHCTAAGIDEPLFALGISRSGVEADAPDNKPVRIFFVVISPKRDPNVHLDALAAASRIFIEAEAREAVIRAGSAEEAIAAIARAEKG